MEHSHLPVYSGYEKATAPWTASAFHNFVRQISPQAAAGAGGEEDLDLDDLTLPEDDAWTRMITADCWDVADFRLGQLSQGVSGAGHLPSNWPSLLSPPPGFSTYNLASTAEESLGSAEDGVTNEKTASSNGAESSTGTSGATEKSDRPARVRGGRRRRGTGSLIDIAKRKTAQQASGAAPKTTTDLSEIVARRLAAQGLAAAAPNGETGISGPPGPRVPLVPSFCPYCGCRAQAPFRFCSNCGTSLHKLASA
mmetsp:Transcript_5853/g.13638  ORF Transcript_5853/g.13638 Transcript_5853/m.13638 type:complete len:253 (-) Transcript_5853:214-972(-)|eukprot:CAMPEP_0206502972 /NCGR_PEP_ID=MMETSP0324_2-20121206/54379_1 /ASSEMBLY_ACC=CAM_ASM_000836 /TAXON_ID=2866 /ORGANISM="Crypthecodinium cohnii, Strain Seligo" /LENGTH=252 /DNA_ID=CAMNT_0053991395 /DNA_START=123 /DNA_END=881 /DNA_ORIENTATION=+